MHQEGEEGRKQSRVAYTILKGVISMKCELDEYLRLNEPDLTGLAEMKLSKGVEELNIGNRKYNMWKRNRRGKQVGVTMLVKKGIGSKQFLLQ